MTVDIGAYPPSVAQKYWAGKESLAEKLLYRQAREVTSLDFQTDRERVALGERIRDERTLLAYRPLSAMITALDETPAFKWAVDAMLLSHATKSDDAMKSAVREAFIMCDEFRSPGGLVSKIANIYGQLGESLERQPAKTPMEGAPVLDATNFSEIINQEYVPAIRGRKAPPVAFHRRPITLPFVGYFVEWHHDVLASSGKPSGHVAWVDVIRPNDILEDDSLADLHKLSQNERDALGGVVKMQIYADYGEDNLAGPAVTSYVLLDTQMKFKTWNRSAAPLVSKLITPEGQRNYVMRASADAVVPLMTMAYGDMHKAFKIKPATEEFGAVFTLDTKDFRRDIKRSLAAATLEL